MIKGSVIELNRKSYEVTFREVSKIDGKRLCVRPISIIQPENNMVFLNYGTHIISHDKSEIYSIKLLKI